jgi:hypothetical protein
MESSSGRVPTVSAAVWTSVPRGDPSFPHGDPSFPPVPTTYLSVRTLIRSESTMIPRVPTMIQAVPASSAGPGDFVHRDETKLSIGTDGSSRRSGQACEGSFGRRKRQTMVAVRAQGQHSGVRFAVTMIYVRTVSGNAGLEGKAPEGVGIKRSD